MNLFVPDFSFNQGDSAQKIGGTKTYGVETTANHARNTYQTATSRDDVNNDQRKKDFAAFLKSEKEQHKTSQKEGADNSAPTKDAYKSSGEKARFFTGESAPTLELIAPQTHNGEEDALHSLQISALHAEIQKLLEAQDTESSETQILTEAPEEARDVDGILSLLVSLLNQGKDDDGTNAENTELGDNISTVLEKIEALARATDATGILSDLTPEEITILHDQIHAYIKDELDQADKEALETLAAQFVTLAQPKEKNAEAAAKKTDAQIASVTQKAADTGLVPEKHHAQSRYDSRYDVAAGSDVSPDDAQALKDGIIKHGSKGRAGTVAQPANSNEASQNAAQRFLTTISTAPGFAPLLPMDGQPQTTVTAGQALTPAQASATNIITQAQQAGQPHPATQMVSATIQKAVKAGEETNIKLRLDPPELGRVEVKMSIDKNNATKIVLTAEKPETFMMLQRDADALHRALNDAGLEAGQGDLSFELASDSHDFGGREGRDSQNGHAQNKGSNSAEEIIETTMDWHVDPESGQMRYDILV